MNLSIVIPAFNEERTLPACVGALRAALDANAARLARYELIVTDNNSSDRTGDVARELGATVVFEPHNQISRARNAGAAAATGDWLLFVDADTLVSAETLADMLDAIESGKYVGGGCAVRFDRATGVSRVLVPLIVTTFRMLRWAGGSFVFCRTEAFREVGGFSEAHYAAEEVFLSRALKAWGRRRGLRFAFLTRRAVVTSSRKLRTHGLGAFLRIALRAAVRPRQTLGSREHLAFFYDGKRDP